MLWTMAPDPAEAVTLFCGHLPGSSSAYFDAIVASTQEILTAYPAEHCDVDAGPLAEDHKDDPDEKVLSRAVDLPAIRPPGLNDPPA